MLSTALVLATSMVVGQPDAAAATIPNPIVKELQFFVGEWTSEGTVQGTPIQGALTLKWSPGQSCLVGDHRVQLGGEEIRGSAAWGWDSATEELLWTKVAPSRF